VWVESGGNKIGAITDLDGKFTIKPLQPGIYNLSVSFISYQSHMLGGVTVNAGKITFLDDINLKTSAKDIGEVVIVEYKDKLIVHEQPGKMTIRGDAMNQMPDNRNLVGMLATITTDIKVSDNGDVYVRGSRSGTEAYYIDGVLVSRINGNVPALSIGSMTVYTGGIPAQYGDVTSGVIVIETKGYFELYNQRQAKLAYEAHVKEMEKREEKQKERDQEMEEERKKYED
ncbi:MAG: carboxypeptidase-like regulatory domain-containing protein, partial [Bacteroidetes bacterium]|nr:carboxypeptidase-like regulatory domain-containing protein [Bacteroidota bacterium]